jgi:hypothetical protein
MNTYVWSPDNHPDEQYATPLEKNQVECLLYQTSVNVPDCSIAKTSINLPVYSIAKLIIMMWNMGFSPH